jgi:O-antigen ligase
LAISFVYTFSRTSYLGVIPLVAVLALLSSRRRLMGGVLLLLLVGSPMVAYLVPTPVVKRVLYTFEPEAGQPTVSLGRIAFDPSTSARLISFRQALEGWMERPILGYGVTGFRFMDAQYPRTLVETGVVGFAAFLWLVWSVLRSGVGAFRALGDPRDRGLALGFVAGTVGLLTHALGANTFIIVRIMEPFWFFAGIVVMLRHLSGEAGKSPAEGS